MTRAAAIAAGLLLMCAGQSAAQAPQLVAAAERGPESAPITILEFSDFECPYCGRMPAVLDEIVKAYPGQVRVIFKHLPLPIHPRAPLAHEASVAAAAQGKFWEMHDLLFANQAKLSRADLEGYASQLQLDMERFKRALDTREFQPVVSRDKAEAAALGVTGTPTLFINGRRFGGAQTAPALRNAIDAMLGRTSAVSLAKLDLKDAPVRGDAAAPVQIIAFSDLQCPFCARATGTIDEVLRKYAGKVRLVFKHFPLPGHAKAPLAHRAALAAGDQGKFWEMHDRIFANMAIATNEGLASAARDLGLDVERFEADLASKKYDALIARDLQEGEALGIDGTPTFFVGTTRIVGARPLADFVAAVDRELGTAAPKTPAPAAPGGFASIGSPNPAVTVTWFYDLRNPLTVEASRVVKQLSAAYPQTLRVVFRHAPLAGRPESTRAYDAALSAGAQGRFWEMQDLLIANQAATTVEDIVALGKRLGLDTAKLEADVRGRAHASVAAEDLAEAKRRDVRGTPTFFVGDERLDGLVTFVQLKAAVDRQLAAAGK